MPLTEVMTPSPASAAPPCLSTSSSFDLVAGAFAREFDGLTSRRHHRFRLMGCLQQQQDDDPFEEQMRSMFLRMHEAMKSVEHERDALRTRCDELQLQVMEGHAKLKGKRTEVKKLTKTCQVQEENLRKSAVLLAIVTHHADELERQVSKLSKWQSSKKKLERKVRQLTKDREELTAILIKALEKKKEVETHAKKGKKKLQDDFSMLSSKVDYLETELEDRKSYIYLIEGELDKYMQQVVTITNDQENYEDDDDEPEAVHKDGQQRPDDELSVTMSFDYADITPATSAETDPEITKQPTLAAALLLEEGHDGHLDYLEDHDDDEEEEDADTVESNARLNVSTIAMQSNLAVSTGMELARSSFKSFNHDVENRKIDAMMTSAPPTNQEQDTDDGSSVNENDIKTPRRRNKGRRSITFMTEHKGLDGLDAADKRHSRKVDHQKVVTP